MMLQRCVAEEAEARASQSRLWGRVEAAEAARQDLEGMIGTLETRVEEERHGRLGAEARCAGTSWWGWAGSADMIQNVKRHT